MLQSAAISGKRLTQCIPGAKFFALLSAPAALLIAVSAACSGGDDDPAASGDDLHSYFLQLSAIASLGNTQTKSLSATYPTAFKELGPTKELYPKYVESYARFLEATKTLAVPESVAGLHQEYVASSEAVLQLNQARLDQLNIATTNDQMNAVFADDPAYTAAVTRQDAACLALKDQAEKGGTKVPGLGDCNNFN